MAHFLVGETQIHDTFYLGPDSIKLYHKNLQLMPADWHYRTKKVEYIYNDKGYRTKPFEKIDWNNSIVIFGCSFIFGMGLAEDETLSYFIEKITGIPAINMGIAGSSMSYAQYNQVVLSEMNVRPKAVINVWTSIDRVLYFDYNTHVNVQCLDRKPKDKSELYYFGRNSTESNTQGQAKLIQRTCRQLWKDTNYCEASFFGNTSQVLNVPFLTYIDFARDNAHYGHKTMEKSAQDLVDMLNL